MPFGNKLIEIGENTLGKLRGDYIKIVRNITRTYEQTEICSIKEIFVHPYNGMHLTHMI